MKVGKILGEIVGSLSAIAVLGGLAYTFVIVPVSQAIQDNFLHDFGGTVQVRGMELDYKGVEPYSPFLPLPWQDKNGYAEVRLNSSKRVFLKYDDLTLSSLEGRIIVKDSKGEEAEFDDKAKYDGKTREEMEKLKDTLGSLNSNRSIRDIVEEEIRQAIAGK